MGTKRTALSAEAIESALERLRGWRHEDGALRKTFQLGTFRDAMAFLVRIGFEAEERNHHPEIANVYGRVDVVLRTHDAGNAVTSLDVELAERIEAIRAAGAK